MTATNPRQASEIAIAYIENHALPLHDVPRLLAMTFHALQSPEMVISPAAEILTPAVPVRKSITPEFLICLKDGKHLKMLKRYLRTHFGMTPEQYRQRWGLPHDYPMVAPNYRDVRSKMARESGLGLRPGARPKGKRGRTSDQQPSPSSSF